MFAQLAICATVLLGGNEGLVELRPDHPELISIEQNIVAQTNTQRQQYGLPPLEVDMNLMQSARQHATWMTLNRILRHTLQPVAENIAMGQGSSQEVVRDWMRSPGHRANILNAVNRRIGVAAFRCPDGTIFWCQQFAP